MHMLNQLLTKIKTALKNETCAHCQAVEIVSRGLICDDCRGKLGIREGFPLAKKGGFTLYSAAMFNPRIKRLLYPYKFYHRTDYAESLADILIDHWQQVNIPEISSENVLVVPIPSRWKENHVSAFAEAFARGFSYGFDDTLLQWERDTIPQHKLTGKKRRWENMSGSMRVATTSSVDLSLPEDSKNLQRDKQTPRIGALTSKTVLIIDDMTTTGATFYEASQAFRRIPDFKGDIINLSLCHVPLALRKQII